MKEKFLGQVELHAAFIASELKGVFHLLIVICVLDWKVVDRMGPVRCF